MGRWFNRIVQTTLAPGAAKYLSAEINSLLAGLGPDAKVLDVGCGYVSMAAAINAKLTCFDVDPVRAKSAAGHSHQALVGSVLKIPLPDEYFEACICVGVLHHLSDLEVPLAVKRNVAGRIP